MPIPNTQDDRFRRAIGAGEVLFREGDPADCAYVVERGRFQVSIQRDGARHVLAELREGALIGEMALVDGGPRTATVTAIQDGALQRLERGHLDERLASADPLVRHVLHATTARYRDVVRRIGRETLPAMPAAPAENPDRSRGVERLIAEQELERALAEQQFVLHFQPIMRLGDQTVAGFEALIRWLHPERGIVYPDAFIPLAEQSGLIVPMGHWIVRTAANALAQMDVVDSQRRHSANPLFMTVNLSARQFVDPDIVTVLKEALEQHRLGTGRLRLEITESMLFDRMEQAAALLNRCRQLGIALAVDDFGTGYSSLSYLYRLPVSEIKLARAFIRDLAQYPESSKIVAAVARLARELKLATIAEGIEKAEQADAVRMLGIEYGQGFHFASAMPLAIASAFVRRSFESSFYRTRPAPQAAAIAGRDSRFAP
jgi:diguanylate cyclase